MLPRRLCAGLTPRAGGSAPPPPPSSWGLRPTGLDLSFLRGGRYGNPVASRALAAAAARHWAGRGGTRLPLRRTPARRSVVACAPPSSPRFGRASVGSFTLSGSRRRPRAAGFLVRRWPVSRSASRGRSLPSSGSACPLLRALARVAAGPARSRLAAGRPGVAYAPCSSAA